MLTQIYIRDLATIEELHLNFNMGSTMITGETGAGKSIFIEAIELGLGRRGSQNIIRPGKDKAEINLCFDIMNFPHVMTRLKTLDLLDDPHECIIRRQMMHDGRSRCYVNETPVTLNLVKELGELLFHLHGQHEEQVLLKSEAQRDMLDKFAGHCVLTQSVKEIAGEIKLVEVQIKNLQVQIVGAKNRHDYLKFQFEELQAVDLKAGEWEILEADHHKLSHADELIKKINAILQMLSNNDGNSIWSSLQDIRKATEIIAHVELKAKIWLEIISSTSIQLNEFESELKNYLDNLEVDADNLQKIEERLSQIFNLARKHKIAPAELHVFKEKVMQELNALNESDDDVRKLNTQLAILKSKYTGLASTLTASRKLAASKLEKQITLTMQSLSLPHGEFKIALEDSAKELFSIHGNEKIIFLIKTNPDQILQPITKVISGGELSRLSLALHLALANRTNIPTLVFDEVDTGLGGATAEKIGKLLRNLGEVYQVFCITHQAQVAAYGHHHLCVEKYFIAKSTHTRLRQLEKDEKTREIARMLGGEKITEKTLDHAKEVLQRI